MLLDGVPRTTITCIHIGSRGIVPPLAPFTAPFPRAAPLGDAGTARVWALLFA